MKKTVVSHETIDDLKKKELQKANAKKLLKKVGVGVIIGAAGIIGYRVGYKNAVKTTHEILEVTKDDNSEMGHKFIEAWNNAVYKYFG